MRKSLSAIGNSLGVVIEKPILELLDIRRDTEFEMTTDGERLILTPIRSITDRRKHHKERVKAATKQVVNTHKELLKKLAE